MMKPKPPDNEREVLTRISTGYWQIDRYSAGRWSNAHAWELKVLYWQELPLPRRDLEGE